MPFVHLTDLDGRALFLSCAEVLAIAEPALGAGSIVYVGCHQFRVLDSPEDVHRKIVARFREDVTETVSYVEGLGIAIETKSVEQRPPSG